MTTDKQLKLELYVDSISHAVIIVTMKWQAIIVLLAISLWVVLPPALPLVSPRGAQAAIGTLDVCHSSKPALLSNGEMPCVSEGSCRLLTVEQIIVHEMINPPCKPVFVAFQDERPPKA